MARYTWSENCISIIFIPSIFSLTLTVHHCAPDGLQGKNSVEDLLAKESDIPFVRWSRALV